MAFSLLGLDVAGVAVESAEYMETAINLSWRERLLKCQHILLKKICSVCVYIYIVFLTDVYIYMYIYICIYIYTYVSQEYYKIC